MIRSHFDLAALLKVTNTGAAISSCSDDATDAYGHVFR